MRYTVLIVLFLSACDLSDFDKMYDCKKCHKEKIREFNGVSMYGLVGGDVRSYVDQVCDDYDREHLIPREQKWSCLKK